MTTLAQGIIEPSEIVLIEINRRLVQRDAYLKALTEEPQHDIDMLRVLTRLTIRQLIASARDLNGTKPLTTEYLRGQVELIRDYADLGDDDGARELIEALIIEPLVAP